MIIEVTQRKSKFIVPDNLFCPREFEVSPIAEKEAKEFVIKNHYSASYPSARRRFGLFWFGRLVGAAVFSHPVNNATITNSFDCPATEAVELGRFILLDEVPFNAESWFFARCRELLKTQGFAGIVSFADDIPRTNLRGEIIFKGHLGTIYAASNGVYVGRGSKSKSFLLPDGLILSPRAISKVRNNEVGADYVCRRLAVFTSVPTPKTRQDKQLWFEMELKKCARVFSHPGNHKYLFKLDKFVSIKNSPKPYPKINSISCRTLFA